VLRAAENEIPSGCPGRGRFDALSAEPRRDEEKSRAKERIYSFRDSLGQWDPKNQRPGLWNIFNSRLGKGESIRVFPLSNWTELDVWLFTIHGSESDRAALFRAERDVFLRNGSIVVIDHPSQLLLEKKHTAAEVPYASHRMRSLHGSDPLPGRHVVPKIIEEMVSFRRSERENRAITTTRKVPWNSKSGRVYF